MESGARTFIAKFSGKSMQPTLKDGMLLLVERVKSEDVQPADIILYKSQDSVVSHRVIKVVRKDGKRIFATKGDNHAYLDAAWVPQQDLIGRVSACFYGHEPQKDRLIKNRFVLGLYVIIGNASLWTRQRRLAVPRFIRAIFKPFVGGFFFVSKKVIHALYPEK